MPGCWLPRFIRVPASGARRRLENAVCVPADGSPGGLGPRPKVLVRGMNPNTAAIAVPEKTAGYQWHRASWLRVRVAWKRPAILSVT